MIKKINTLVINRAELLLQTLRKEDYEISEILVSKIYALKNIDDELEAILEDVMFGDYAIALLKLHDYTKSKDSTTEIKSKIRISNLVKKLNLSSKEVISYAQQLGLDVKSVISTLSEEDADRLIESIRQKEMKDNKELNQLKKELKSLELKLQTLIEQKTEYLSNIEEFNRDYNLYLGELIRTILNLKKEILYKKTIKQQKQKEKYNEDKQTFKETTETIDELNNTIDELKEALESIDESHESYDET